MRHYLLFNEDVCSSVAITGVRLHVSVGQWCMSPRSSEAFFPRLAYGLGGADGGICLLLLAPGN